MFYYRDADGKVQGPMPFEALQRAAQEGAVREDTPVWGPQLSGWQPYGQSLGRPVSVPPPLPHIPGPMAGPPPLPAGFASGQPAARPRKRRWGRWVAAAVFVLGVIIWGVVDSDRPRAEPAEPVPANPAEIAARVARTLPGVQRHYEMAEKALAAGELEAGYGGVSFGRRAYGAVAKLGPDTPAGDFAPGLTVKQFDDQWRARLEAALTAGLPAALARLGDARERMAAPDDLARVGLPQAAAMAKERGEEIAARRVLAAARFVRLQVLGEPRWRAFATDLLKQKFPADTEALLVFEPPLSPEEDAATWRTLRTGAAVAESEYYHELNGRKELVLTLPEAVKLGFDCRLGPGPATSWDELPDFVEETRTPDSVTVRTNNGVITNRGEFPSPDTYYRRLEAALRASVVKDLPEFAVTGPAAPVPPSTPEAPAAP